MTKKQIIAEIEAMNYYYNSETEEGFEFWKEAVKKVPEFIKQDIASLRESVKEFNDMDMEDFIFSKEFGEILKPLNLDIQVETESRIDNGIIFTEFVEDFQKYIYDLAANADQTGVTFFEKEKTEKNNCVRVFFSYDEFFIDINHNGNYEVFKNYQSFLNRLFELINYYKLEIV